MPSLKRQQQEADDAPSAKRKCVFPGVVFDIQEVLPGTEEVVFDEACRVTPTDLRQVASCTTIKAFTMKNWPLEQEGLDQLGNCELEELNLHGAYNLVDPALQFLSGQRKLYKLTLSDCTRLAGFGLTYALNITVLDLSGCLGFLGPHLAHVGAIKTLKELFLTNCHGVTDAHLHLLLPLQHLAKLVFGWCSEITDTGVRVLASLPELTELVLDGCRVTGQGFDAFPKDGRLKVLEMQSCPLSSEGCLQLPPTILKLNVSRCHSLTDADIAALAHTLPLLELFHFGACRQLTEAIYPALLSLANLQHLKISSSRFNSSHALAELSKMKGLLSLVTGVSTFSEEMMQELREALPNTKVHAYSFLY